MMRRSFALSALLALAWPAHGALFTMQGAPGQLVIFGLVADTPPASADGAVFIEVDSAKVFLRTGGAWVEQLNASYQPLATDLTRLVDNCVVENDATPIPDSCVGDGTDGGGGVDTANSPNANEVARFTDADTIEGRTAAEFKADVDLEIGTDLAPSNLDYLVGTASGNLSAEIAVGTSPGGELGGTWASPTLDDSVTVDTWTLGSATVGSTAAANDNDTSLATTAFVQGEIDDVDNLSDNCAVENDATPVPDSCVGNGTDDGAATNLDYLVGTATGGLSAEIAVGTSPGGELGGTWASPTLDDGITVDTWALGASTATTAAANDNDTSLATTAFVQGEIDDVDLLSDNCVLENDATPIPDSCVGDGSDAGAGGGAPTTVDYLVGTADGTLSNEIVVGTSPGGELGGTWASPTLDDSVSVTGWTIDELNLDAGSASAGSWPNFTSGTVLTTAEDGALELDANTLYFTTDAGNRGYVPVRHIIRAAATRTFVSNTNEQAIFDSPANGRITLETGTYLVTGLIRMTAMSGTSGNASVDLLGAGTATVTNWLWMANGQDRNAASAGANGGTLEISQQSVASIVTAGTATQLGVQIQGSFEVTGAGTMIPSMTLVTASAAVIGIGTYITFERIGATGLVSIGQVD